MLLQQIIVLLVEEDPDNLELMAGYLRLAGATVHEASSIRAALETMGPINVVVSELLLVDGDGCELLRRLRAQAGRELVPALALTALTDVDWQRRALAGGFDQCVIKPFPLGELAQRLFALCRRSN